MSLPWIKAVDLLSKVVPLVAPTVIGAIRERMLPVPREGRPDAAGFDQELLAVQRELHALLIKLDVLWTDLLIVQRRARTAAVVGAIAMLVAMAALGVAAFK